MEIRDIDILVIGAGQAGLALSYFLKKLPYSFLLVDKVETIGVSWASRYDSLELFTRRESCALPGMPFPGEKDGYPRRDEMVAYLQEYSRFVDPPLCLNTPIEELTKREMFFEARSPHTLFRAGRVVIATGGLGTPFIPKENALFSREILQIHSGMYKNPSSILPGTVLIVGAGNSGTQIAVELAYSKSHTVYLSTQKNILICLPKRIFGKSLSWWGEKVGYFSIRSSSWLGKNFQKKKEPIVGRDICRIIRSGNIQKRPAIQRIEKDVVTFTNQSNCKPRSIIWATGWKNDYSWIRISEPFLTPEGGPLHKEGTSAVPGLYFLGILWQRSISSGIIRGLGKDAPFIAEHIHRSFLEKSMC